MYLGTPSLSPRVATAPVIDITVSAREYMPKSAGERYDVSTPLRMVSNSRPIRVPANITPEPITILLTESLTDMLTPFYYP